jgi:RNase P protein component
MRKLGREINQTLADWESSSEEARINLRIQQVRNRYRRAIEEVYKESAPLHLAHTNNVIITVKNGVKTLIVYVDDSIFAAELNAQRELVWLKLLELFGEEVDDFQILISRYKKFREMHPYLTESQQEFGKNSATVPLDEEEKSFVSDTISQISDKKVRDSLEKAMTADLEWKKGKK